MASLLLLLLRIYSPPSLGEVRAAEGGTAGAVFRFLATLS